MSEQKWRCLVSTSFIKRIPVDNEMTWLYLNGPQDGIEIGCRTELKQAIGQVFRWASNQKGTPKCAFLHMKIARWIVETNMHNNKNPSQNHECHKEISVVHVNYGIFEHIMCWPSSLYKWNMQSQN